MTICGGKSLMLMIAALASASWTASVMFSTYEFGRSKVNKHTGVPADETPIQKKSYGGGLKSLISGAFGGMCVVLVGHPLDLIKVRMQTSSKNDESSMLQKLVYTFRESGVRGMYRGVSAPLLAAAFVFAVSFWGYDAGQRILRYFTHHSDLTMLDLCLAGGLSGIPTALLMAPSERIKVLMQTDSRYTTMVGCALDIIREGGMVSLMRGTLLTLLRDVPGSMAWFGTYEYIKHLFVVVLGHANASHLPSVVTLFAGGLAGMAYWAVSMPVDVLKSRLQAAPEGTYAGVFDVARQVLREEGLSALFKGTAPALIRAFPANAACFFGMEVSKNFLDYLEAILYP